MRETRFLFLEANPPWLDFVNTALVDRGRPVDLLGRFADAAEWLGLAKLLPAPRARAAAARWEGTAPGRAALARIKALRRELRSAAERLWKGDRLPAEALRAINRALRESSGSFRLVARGRAFRLDFEVAPRRALDLLEPLARSAAEFLVREDPGRVRKCGNPVCVLYFHDGTKNGTRRWCRMAVCGNRMKAAAHYRRRHPR